MGLAVPTIASARGSLPAHDDSSLAWYSYGDVELGSGSGAEVDSEEAQVEVLVGLMVFALLGGALLAAGLFFRRRALTRERPAKEAVSFSKPTAHASVSTAEDSACGSAQSMISSTV